VSRCTNATIERPRDDLWRSSGDFGATQKLLQYLGPLLPHHTGIELLPVPHEYYKLPNAWSLSSPLAFSPALALSLLEPFRWFSVYLVDDEFHQLVLLDDQRQKTIEPPHQSLYLPVELLVRVSLFLVLGHRCLG
jgi:hypothetical protein